MIGDTTFSQDRVSISATASQSTQPGLANSIDQLLSGLAANDQFSGPENNIVPSLINTNEIINEEADPEINNKLPPSLALIKSLLEHLFGVKIEIIDIKNKQDTDEFSLDAENNANSLRESEPVPVRYEYSESYTESEQTQFVAQGTVKTTDGKEIQIDVELNMSRSFSSEFNLVIDNGVRTDPLVINFDGTAAQLTEKSFKFDLDFDGDTELIPELGSNSGFLALDKNNDGHINDGSELFGPLTGNGFTELEKYDDDKNRFIDENDEIFSRLSIWVHHGEENDHLYGLLDRNIGAIYLGYEATPFSLKDSSNLQLGQIRSSGIYLNENGGAGTIQQIDLVV